MKIIISLLLLVLINYAASAQLQIPELSPPGSVIQEIGHTTIEVNYERPAARGRSSEQIFGKLVPYGKVWRTGAGNCTTISFSEDVWIGGQRVKQGKYALFTIPEEKQWTIILNTDTTAYGAYKYHKKNDIVRLDVPVIKSQRFYESLTIDIDFIPNNARIFISWLDTQLAFDVNTGTDKAINEYLSSKVFNGESKNADDYVAGIDYLLWHGGDRERIMDLIEKGITLKSDRVWYYWKVEELMKNKQWDKAKSAAKAGIQVIENSNESQARKMELIKDFEVYLQKIADASRQRG